MTRFLAAAVLVLAAAGCDDAGRRGQTAGETVNLVLSRRASLTSLQAQGAMRITDPENQFYLGVNIDVAAQKPSSLRITADKLAGKIKAFDIVVVDEDILFYVPRKHTLFQGKLSDLSQAKKGFIIKPSDILSHLLQDNSLLVGCAWKKISAPDTATLNLVTDSLRFFLMQKSLWFEEIHQPGNPFFRMQVDEKTLDLMMLQRIGADGEILYAEMYSMYAPVRQGKVFPNKMVLSWPSEKKQVAVHLKQMKVNRPIDPSAFALEVEENVKTKSILDARVDSDKEGAEQLEKEGQL